MTDEPRNMKVLRALTLALLLPSLVLSGVYIKGMIDPPANRDSQDFFSNGAPVFFVTLALLYLLVRKPGARD